ncbi:MAG: hypothetical protein COA36_16805 [Desulfotalea sp.]|nr:MAG: hypothetical protein COA36_16805 [Desulfotalea sp.]
MTYFNTTNIEGEDLKKATEKADAQGVTILAHFKANENTLLNAWEIKCLLFPSDTILTSVRRALSVLKKDSKLDITDVKRPGQYKAVNRCYKLNDKLKPQMDLFKD